MLLTIIKSQPFCDPSELLGQEQPSTTPQATTSSIMGSSAASATHILVFPYPAQGHMLPLLDLTHLLALRGLTITILVTPKNLPILSPLLSAHPSIQTVALPFPPHPKLPLGVEHIKDIGNRGNPILISALSKLQSLIIEWFKSHPAPPQVILSDFFLGWTNHLAAQLGVPRIAFFSSGAFLSSVGQYLLGHMEVVRGSQVVHLPDLPGSPSFIEPHLPSLIRFHKEADLDWRIVRDGMVANFSSWGCVFNSFHALEGAYLDHLKNKLGHDRVYGVGPLSLMGGGTRSPKRYKLDSDAGRHSVMDWLDDQPDGSVLYVCFGSQKVLTRGQTEALASGLERSMARFVWVVRKAMRAQLVVDGEGNNHDDDEAVIPSGFEERVRERGFIVHGWAPQVEVLNHKAVGGFMSHCGWNSVQESVAAGVIVLAWPMEADQFVNTKLLVDDLGVAVRVWDTENGEPDSTGLAKIIRETIGGNTPQKERARVLKQKVFEEVEEGGSSCRSLEELVKELNVQQGR